MGTLADEERTFLLKATGLPEDATINDLRYAYFKGVNTGEIEQGTKLPKSPPYNALLKVDSTGTYSWTGVAQGSSPNAIPIRDGAGHIFAPISSEPGLNQYVSRANVDKMIAGKTGTSRVDTTVGKRIFVSDGTTEHMVYGDTGQRNIIGLFPEGWTVPSAKLVRINSIVTLQFQANTTLSGTQKLFNTPLGFRPASPVLTSLVKTTTGWAGSLLITDADFTVYALSSGGTNVYLTLTYITSDPWPTAPLPGTPA